jgi:hypothetical protein
MSGTDKQKLKEKTWKYNGYSFVYKGLILRKSTFFCLRVSTRSAENVTTLRLYTY